MRLFISLQVRASRVRNIVLEHVKKSIPYAAKLTELRLCDLCTDESGASSVENLSAPKTSRSHGRDERRSRRRAIDELCRRTAAARSSIVTDNVGVVARHHEGVESAQDDVHWFYATFTDRSTPLP